MSKVINIQITEKSAKELADLDIKLGNITYKEYKERVMKYMKPQKALFG